MQRKRGTIFAAITETVVIAVITAGCNFLFSEVLQPHPLYTPITFTSDVQAIPTKSRKVTIEELVSQPEKYDGQFIEVQGLNSGGMVKPDCYPYIGPPTDWYLVASTPEYKEYLPVNYPARIEVKNTFDGMLSDPSDPLTGHATRNTMMKKVAVWGWWRLYHGSRGCESKDISGNSISLPVQDIWYLDAVKLQFLESIEVNP